tara:strand:- start:246 stop:1532 length:1287 start_codon:yes stop_codon:yes gene_type:complete
MITRRRFVTTTAAAAGLLGTGLLGMPAAIAGEIMPKSGKRVVVIGGGWGGATAAKYIRMMDPSIEVVMIEREPVFRSCPLSNWVIGGIRSMDDITVSYEALASEHGVKVVQDTVQAIDPDAHAVDVTAGRIKYDRLILSPGIEIIRGSIPGLDEAESVFPAAWKAGPETVELRRQLEAMPIGGTVVLTVPLGPYRCPPGPYERTSLIADYLRQNKPGSKIVVFDANQKIVSKGPLFSKAWADFYGDIVDYRPDHKVTRVDAESRMIYSDFDEIKADVGNVIPPQRASRLVFDAGLVPEGRSWAPVDPMDFTSTENADVHVIGDAVDTTTVGPVPKSGFVANSMGKVAAAAAVARLNDAELAPPTLANTCYSLVSADEGISVTAVYQWNPETKKVEAVDGSKGVSPERSRMIAHNAQDWAQAIWADMLA